MGKVPHMLTKSQFRIMQVFVSSISKSFSPADISKAIGMDYKDVHTNMKALTAEKLLTVDHSLYHLNYKENIQQLAYVEHLRCREFLEKKKNRFVKLFIEDALKKIKDEFFIFLIFGSTVDSQKPNDTDVFVLAKTREQATAIEKNLDSIVTNLKLDIHVHWEESAVEMLEKRESANLLNRILDKHLIFYGAETFYRLLATVRR